jgi:DNA-binding response OmpR family regulator
VEGGPRQTVLVVEDEPALRLLCRVNLELDGFDVLEAATLTEARSRLESSTVDVVLLDLHLGRELGHTLVQELAGRTPRVPVALVSGTAELPSAQEAGADAVLPKPFQIERLLDTVRTLAAPAGGAR